VTFKEVLPYHALTVICSSVSYAIFLIIIEPSYRAIIAFFMISFITLIPYSIAAVPLQVILNKWPKKFNILYLFIYCVVATLFLYISYKLQGNWSDPIRDYRKMFTFAVGAAVIYWLWDSIIMNKDKYPYY
jgi:zinc transporter ZupT